MKSALGFFLLSDFFFRLNKRLSTVLRWAEAQGLEMAAECHLSRIGHAAQLLSARKSSIDDLSDICSLCYKLNSHQIAELMQRYQIDPSEPPVDADLIENLLKVAETTTDESARSDGRPISGRNQTFHLFLFVNYLEIYV